MTPELTVCCVCVAGPVVGYSVEYVVRLERMVRKHLARPYRFLCFTDGTKGEMPRPIDTIRVAKSSDQIPEPVRGIWTKLQVFNPAHNFRGRMLFLDLDVLVVAPLDPIVDFPAGLALTEDAFVVERAHLNKDRYGRRLVRKFNSSVMVWNAGAHDHLFTEWTIADTLDYSTDQDYIGERAPNARPMPLAWFPRVSQVRPPWPPDAKVALCKKPKNAEAVKMWPELIPWWGPEVAA